MASPSSASVSVDPKANDAAMNAVEEDPRVKKARTYTEFKSYEDLSNMMDLLPYGWALIREMARVFPLPKKMEIALGNVGGFVYHLYVEFDALMFRIEIFHRSQLQFVGIHCGPHNVDKFTDNDVMILAANLPRLFTGYLKVVKTIDHVYETLRQSKRADVTFGKKYGSKDGRFTIWKGDMSIYVGNVYIHFYPEYVKTEKSGSGFYPSYCMMRMQPDDVAVQVECDDVMYKLKKLFGL